MPTPWIQVLVGRQPLGDREPEAAAVAGQEVPLLDRCPCRRSSRRRASRGRCPASAPATISLADGGPAIDEHRRPRSPGRSRRRRPSPPCGTWSPIGVLLPVDRAAADELAGDRRAPRPRSRPGRRAGRGRSARGALVELLLELAVEVVGGAAAEPVDARGSRRAVREEPSCSRPRRWMTSRVMRQLHGLAVPDERQSATSVPRGPRTRSTTSSTRRALDRRAVDGRPAGRPRADRPPRPVSRAGRRRRSAGRPSPIGVQATPVAVLGRHLGADALELAGDARQARSVLVGGHVRGVGVIERVEHALDGALDERSWLEVADVLRGDLAVRLPERLEQLLLAAPSCRASATAGGRA